MSWRVFLFQQCHVGPFGGHKNAVQTEQMLRRIAWWPSAKRDISLWVDRCWVCVQYRKKCTKVPASFIITTSFLPWQEVMVDIEGPSCPPDRAGHVYVLTYSDLLSGGSILEPITQLRHNDFRRAFSRALMRSGTFPVVCRSDRGSEMRNLMMFELNALLGVRQRFGQEWRPVEQAVVEREHQETQKYLGILLFEVFRCMPGELGDLLPVVEFIRYNTPGRTGLTPRDVDRQWSVSSPL